MGSPVKELIFEKIFNDFYEKFNEILKEKIFDKKKLDKLTKEIYKYHIEFCKSHQFANSSKFQKFVENNLKIEEQYYAILKINPSHLTIDAIQKKIISDCIREFSSINVFPSEINTYFNKIFDMINKTLYHIAEKTNSGMTNIIINELNKNMESHFGFINYQLSEIIKKQNNDLEDNSIKPITEMNSLSFSSQNEIYNEGKQLYQNKQIFNLNAKEIDKLDICIAFSKKIKVQTQEVKTKNYNKYLEDFKNRIENIYEIAKCNNFNIIISEKYDIDIKKSLKETFYNFENLRQNIISQIIELRYNKKYYEIFNILYDMAEKELKNNFKEFIPIIQHDSNNYSITTYDPSKHSIVKNYAENKKYIDPGDLRIVKIKKTGYIFSIKTDRVVIYEIIRMPEVEVEYKRGR